MSLLDALLNSENGFCFWYGCLAISLTSLVRSGDFLHYKYEQQDSLVLCLKCKWQRREGACWQALHIHAGFPLWQPQHIATHTQGGGSEVLYSYNYITSYNQLTRQLTSTTPLSYSDLWWWRIRVRIWKEVLFLSLLILIADKVIAHMNIFTHQWIILYRRRSQFTKFNFTYVKMIYTYVKII